MEQTQSSIFNQDFIQETWIRRRDLMPLGLKILVWFFLVFAAISLPTRLFYFLKYQSTLDFSEVNRMSTFYTLGDFLFSFIQIVAYLLLLFEVKPAVFFALIVAGIALLLGLYSFVSFWFYDLHYSLAIMDGVKCILQGVFFLLLFRIRKAWEMQAFSGKELRVNKNNL
jgi:hypothetical protein